MSLFVGIFACAISAVFFGCMFVPIKRYDAGDGIFVQFIMSIVIWIIGFCVYVYEGFPPFYPIAILGGVFWTIGNSTAIPIIRRLGMALGILIWNTTNCLAGWAGGRFGLFGMTARPPASPLLNYLGLGCVIIGGIIFSRVKSGPSTTKKEVSEEAAEKVALNSPTEIGSSTSNEEKIPFGGRTLGFAMALVAGLFYGITFVPVIRYQDNVEGAPQDGLPYVFSHYTGILLTATLIFFVYTIIHKSSPHLDGRLILPGCAAGFLWAVAQSSFFVANTNLSQTVTFPIITMLPGVIASIWSIFYFKEITGRRNYIFMAVAMSITLMGSLLVGLSKDYVL